MTDAVINTLSNTVNYISKFLPEKKEVETVVIKEIKEMYPRNGLVFLRLAGVSGAIAVAMGAYGAHVFRHSEADQNLKVTYETGSRYHFIHTLALLSVPLTRRPMLVGSLLCTGMVLFSGSCYYHALTSNNTVRKVTPYGGMLLILGWAAMAL